MATVESTCVPSSNATPVVSNAGQRGGSVCGPDVLQAELPAAVTVVGAAQICGVCAHTIYRMMGSGQFGPQPMRFGVGRRALRFLRAEILEWLAAGAPSRERWVVIRRSPK